MTDKEERRPPANGTALQVAAKPDTTVQAWADAYSSARQWVEWNGRKRWPDAATNDEIWALSVTQWEIGRSAWWN